MQYQKGSLWIRFSLLLLLLLFRFDLGAVYTNCDDIIRKKVRHEENIVCVHIEYDFEQSNFSPYFHYFSRIELGGLV